MELHEKVARVRARLPELDQGEWPPVLGGPAALDVSAEFPESLRPLYEVFDGLSAEVIQVDRTGRVLESVTIAAESDLFDPIPDLVQFGNVIFGSMLGVSMSNGGVHLVSEASFMDALEQFELLETDPIAPDAIAFADAFLFGPRYFELIDLAGGYPNPGTRHRDAWRLVLEDLGLL
ncbi:hypothetical protein [Glycomyces buryatensis]|uniref:Uncharacterized protein n=1 Tax=Glycomyces buryatensis TaxID=2570927 RepID=A0A4S8Q1C9_9ACTN|nr:hypothetical protein [Glycomyces buryatensis]THV37750.1 hypothetical protein FAB82_20110 [Glycomyces buryatensis]